MPYYALTSELTDDYDERSSLTTYRMVMAVPAYLVGAALTPAIVGLFALQRTGYAFIGIVYGVLAALALLISAAGIPRAQAIGGHPSRKPSPFKSLARGAEEQAVRLVVRDLFRRQHLLCLHQDPDGLLHRIPAADEGADHRW